MDRAVISYPGKSPKQIVASQAAPVVSALITQTVPGTAGIIPFDTNVPRLADGTVFISSWGTKIRFTSAGNISGTLFTITGYDVNGTLITENLAGPNTSTWTDKSYSRLISIIANSSYSPTSFNVVSTVPLNLYGQTSYSPAVFDNYAAKIALTLTPWPSNGTSLRVYLEGKDILGNDISEFILTTTNGSPILSVNSYAKLNRYIFLDSSPSAAIPSIATTVPITTGWVNLNYQSQQFNANYQVVVPGTMTYTINSTMSPVYPVGQNINPSAPISSSSIVSFATSPSSTSVVAPVGSGVYALQMVISAAGASDTSSFTIVQQGVV